MIIKVKSFFKAQKFIDSEHYDKAISLISPTEDRCSQRDNHLIMRFDDAEVEHVIYEGEEYVGPSYEQMIEILDFSKSIQENDVVMVHCTAGKSRSTAIAMSLLIQHGSTPKQALESVLRAREEEGSSLIVPNRLIVKYMDEILNQNGDFIQEVDNYYEMMSQTVPMELIKRGRHSIED
jgi:predicted protein tyrosine phosphatase